MKLTKSQAHYLKAIYQLESINSSARVSDVATKLDVSKPSVSRAVKKLEDTGYIYRNNQLIHLTDDGYKIAKTLMTKYNTIKNYFVNTVNLDTKTANTVACALEHLLDIEKTKLLTQS